MCKVFQVIFEDNVTGSTRRVWEFKPRTRTSSQALTGHVEGSRAFTRYRTIDMDMKKDFVKILEGKQ